MTDARSNRSLLTRLADAFLRTTGCRVLLLMATAGIRRAAYRQFLFSGEPPDSGDRAAQPPEGCSCPCQ